MKKMLSFALTIVLIAALFPILTAAQSESALPEGYVYENVPEGGYIGIVPAAGPDRRALELLFPSGGGNPIIWRREDHVLPFNSTPNAADMIEGGPFIVHERPGFSIGGFNMGGQTTGALPVLGMTHTATPALRSITDRNGISHNVLTYNSMSYAVPNVFYTMGPSLEVNYVQMWIDMDETDESTYFGYDWRNYIEYIELTNMRAINNSVVGLPGVDLSLLAFEPITLTMGCNNFVFVLNDATPVPATASSITINRVQGHNFEGQSVVDNRYVRIAPVGGLAIGEYQATVTAETVRRIDPTIDEFGNFPGGLNGSNPRFGLIYVDSNGNPIGNQTGRPFVVGEFDVYEFEVNPHEIRVVKSATPAQVDVGQTVRYTIRVENLGTGTIRNLTLTDELNEDLGFLGLGNVTITGTPAGSFEVGLPEYADGTFTLEILRLNGGAVLTVSFDAEVIGRGCEEYGKIRNIAVVTGDSLCEDEESNENYVVVSPYEIRVVKSATPAQVEVGQTVRYTIRVENIGVGTAINLTLTDELNEDLEFLGLGNVTITGAPAGSFEVGLPEYDDGTFTLEILRLDAGAVLTVSFDARVIGTGCEEYSKIRNIAVVSGDGLEDDEESNENYVVVTPPRDEEGPFITDHLSYIIGYPDGSVRPLSNISRAEVATVYFRLLTDTVRNANWTQVNEFTDVHDRNWHNTAVSIMYSMNIVRGYADGSFRPNEAITRAELATIAARFSPLMNLTRGEAPRFTDISGHWAEDYINAAAAYGWLNGYPDGTFRPNAPIRRAEFMTLVNRMLGRVPRSVNDLIPAEMNVWPDNMNQTAWYYLVVQEATNSTLPGFHNERVPGTNFFFKYWAEMLEDPDWLYLETVWTAYHNRNGR